jgi:amidophosphoribosyltransferase
MGLVRNHYVGRTFIEPKQSIRHFGVKVKLNPVRSVVAGKRVILVDDSIVRGTTSKKIVKMLKAAGAAEIHMRISSPPTKNPCHYGIDTPRRKELIASTHDLEETRKFIEADSLGYLSLDGMLTAFGRSENDSCAACFSGRYPIPLTVPDPQATLFPTDEPHADVSGERPAETFPRLVRTAKT